jgi:hypothetical protein
MEDIVNKRCLEPTCKKWPSFGLPDDNRPTYCKSHMKTGMQDIVSKRCLEPACKTQPCYGRPDDARPTYCSRHHQSSMVNIVNRNCLEPACKTKPCHGRPDDARPTYCSQHSKVGMQNIVGKRCIFQFQTGERCSTHTVGKTDKCTVHQPGYIKSASGYSKVCCAFLDAYMHKHGVTIQHKHYDPLTGKLSGSEHLVRGLSSCKSGATKVDGWIADNNMVLEFHGDYYHGNPTVFAADERNNTLGCTFGELYEKTMDRMAALKSLGLAVVYIWERDFRQWQKMSGLYSVLPVKTV